jgi:hypothetical protein
MFVQDINVLRRVATQSLIKDRTARDLETRKIANFVERIEEALAKAVRIAKRVTKVAKQERERTRELYLRRRREKVQAYGRKRNRGLEMAI